MLPVSVAFIACLPLSLTALPVDRKAALLERGDGIVDDGLSGFDFDADSVTEYKPKKRHHEHHEHIRDTKNLTDFVDEAIAELQLDFKTKTQQLKVAMAWFKEKQKAMDAAKKEATAAMKTLRKEAERRRKTAADRKLAKVKEHRAKEEAKRTAKDAMVKKAQALMGAKGSKEGNTMLGDMSLGIMVDVLMALPAAVENPIFLKRLGKAKENIVTDIQDFLNMTRRKTSKFVLASSKASDVELSFLMARYFHEASFRAKAMQSDAEKIARDLNIVMPRELRASFLPIIRSVRLNAVPLRVNASSLASASLSEACTQISSLMANISDYNNKLTSMHTTVHSVWQIAELMLPHMSKIYPMKAIVVDTVKDIMSLATTQIAGLQESADEIVTNVGPVVAERMQCTWSAAQPCSRFGPAAVLVALLSHLLLAH